ncbi:hypothetical protein MM239_19095 [Belliella sp. DSM 111904]|uniref:Uncharacterized protein n=1 Tax=Belliella filtrata TaxID=2923435 RepID=A0ABS9V6D8_9BACT|nr:hypothetical protein [Belliella filtrata]MCH7411503.1 hypothetical protein [Belliella filtrata]
MEHKVRLIGMSTSSFCSSLSQTHIDALLSKLNITVHSNNANKKIFLKLGLRKCTLDDACTLLLNEFFGDSISQTLKSYYKFKILTHPEDLFEKSIHQKEVLCIYNLLSNIFDKPETAFPIINIDILINQKEILSPSKVLKILSSGCLPHSRLNQWVNNSYEENFAQQMILNFESHGFGSYKVGLNNFWIRTGDFQADEWYYTDSNETLKI